MLLLGEVLFLLKHDKPDDVLQQSLLWCMYFLRTICVCVCVCVRVRSDEAKKRPSESWRPICPNLISQIVNLLRIMQAIGHFPSSTHLVPLQITLFLIFSSFSEFALCNCTNRFPVHAFAAFCSAWWFSDKYTSLRICKGSMVLQSFPWR